MRVYTTAEEYTYTQSIETMLFFIDEVNGKFNVVWKPNVLNAIRLPRYDSFFKTFDMCRTNAQTILNARCNSETDYRVIAQLLNESIHNERSINQLLNQCLWELGL
ncbi:hypothetical protein HYQ21_gp086 [Acinetobacter phage vB_AbaM_Apostate]|uniref:Uncharacterized protein n=1 Tax=Acinetobacter phage vB_AbaM_Apostate TaxID=2686308 RepID=A0A6B9J8I8_9CAUD|nr:hypothetical protein HYQ21_gp086 [Acinetobacter phage vB_AbaM_Apostate]QGZ15677.1 hypothetical protein Apostate_086 [Acinetobacter phage vB_AbaM_Apostate]